jgi:hypothetical protein
MRAKSEFYNTINTKNMVSLDDVSVDKDDSIARNTLNVYFLGAHINSNLLNTGDYLSYTLRNKKDKIKRI